MQFLFEIAIIIGLIKSQIWIYKHSYYSTNIWTDRMHLGHYLTATLLDSVDIEHRRVDFYSKTNNFLSCFSHVMSAIKSKLFQNYYYAFLLYFIEKSFDRATNINKSYKNKTESKKVNYITPLPYTNAISAKSTREKLSNSQISKYYSTYFQKRTNY